ncbi:MAG: flagellar motor protein [Bryobacteraceae bacterium]|nr:flagellar motor protein [Bryobacteraceae bacterium]
MADSRPGRRLDKSSFAGLVIALAGIVGGFLIEGGKAEQMVGLSAALIVFGGCAGAVMVANPLPLIASALRRLNDVLFETTSDTAEMIDQVVNYAVMARKNGLVSLENEAMSAKDPYLRKSLLLAVDGADLDEIRSMMQLESDVAESRAEQEAKVFESAGGFAPTIGIIGAVLGLIIVMGQIDDMNKVGHGIAAAFVATIYGVGSANLVLLPAAHKIKARAAHERERQEMILAGVCGIVEGLNPKLIRTKLEAFAKAPGAPERKAAKG